MCGADDTLGSRLLGDPLERHGHVIVRAVSADNPTRIQGGKEGVAVHWKIIFVSVRHLIPREHKLTATQAEIERDVNESIGPNRNLPVMHEHTLCRDTGRAY